MTLNELMQQMLAVFPKAVFDETHTGEVVVYTGLAAHPEANWDDPASCGLTPVDKLV